MARKPALGRKYEHTKAGGGGPVRKSPVTTDKGVSPQKRVSDKGNVYYKHVTDREKYSVYLLPDSIQQVKDAVSFLMGAPAYLTVSTFFEQAIQHEVDRLAKEHHSGEPFPTVKRLPRGPRPGRPID
jgi:hypothetical protein